MHMTHEIAVDWINVEVYGAFPMIIPNMASEKQ